MNDFQQVKFEIFIPEAYIERLQAELHKIGVGRIGDYDHCLSITEVRGTWRPLAGSQPYAGEVGQVSEGTECKVEINCPRDKASAALAVIRQVHPYDEPLVNIIPLVNHLF